MNYQTWLFSCVRRRFSGAPARRRIELEKIAKEFVVHPEQPLQCAVIMADAVALVWLQKHQTDGLVNSLYDVLLHILYQQCPHSLSLQQQLQREAFRLRIIGTLDNYFSGGVTPRCAAKMVVDEWQGRSNDYPSEYVDTGTDCEARQMTAYLRHSYLTASMAPDQNRTVASDANIVVVLRRLAALRKTRYQAM